MMLVQEGKPDLDEPITTYLPKLDFIMINRIEKNNLLTLEKSENKITLRHLLSHTSGMTFPGGAQAQPGKIDIIPLDSGVYISKLTPLSFNPGEGQ